MTTTVRALREVVREGPLRRREILRALEGGPLTVPEIAEAIGAPSREAMFWVMDMRRYGFLAELPETDEAGRFRYRAIERGRS